MREISDGCIGWKGTIKKTIGEGTKYGEQQLEKEGQSKKNKKSIRRSKSGPKGKQMIGKITEWRIQRGFENSVRSKRKN